MPSDLDLMRQIFTLLEGNVFFGDRLTERQFVALLSPGQFISDKLDPADGADAYTIATLADKALGASFLYKPLNHTVSGQYAEVLKAALPHIALTPAQTRLLTQTRDRILVIEPAFQDRQDDYQDADYAYSKAIAEHAPDADVVRLRQLRDRALANWQNYGFKDEYERLKGVEWGLIALDPARDWAAAKTQMDSYLRNSSLGSGYQTNLIPAPTAWAGAGWTKQTICVRDTFSSAYSRSTHFDAGGGAGFGLWSFGGNYSQDQQWRHDASSTSNVDISFEYLVVNVDRPWLKTDLFEARNWAWKKQGQTNVYLSDGGNLTAASSTAPQGYLPLLPTAWFVVRNVEISGQWTQADMNYHASQISAGTSFGWGPISVHGNYSESTSSTTATSHFQNATLVIDQPQIIAVMGDLLNMAPNPDPSLAWGPDANLARPTYLVGATPEDVRQIKRDLLREEFAYRDAVAALDVKARGVRVKPSKAPA